MDLKVTKSKVEDCLRKYPHTRNSDKILIAYYIVEHHGQLLFDKGDRKCIAIMDMIFGLPSYGAITRARRKFQQDGKYLPTDPEVKKIRRRTEERYREVLGYNPELRTI